MIKKKAMIFFFDKLYCKIIDDSSVDSINATSTSMKVTCQGRHATLYPTGFISSILINLKSQYDYANG